MSRKIHISAVVIAALALSVLFWSLSRHHTTTKVESPSGIVNEPAVASNWAALSRRMAGSGVRGLSDGNAENAQFSDPYGVAQDSAGNIYVSDAGENNLIRKISADGTVSTIAGHGEGLIDGPGLAASFNTPSGLALDRAGNIYVADAGNNAIRKIDVRGNVITIAGDGQAGSRDGRGAQARFNGPLGLAVDAQGIIYVADTYNDSVRRIATDGVVTTLAGGVQAGFQDGLAESALFDTPCNVLLDAQGNLIVADTHNNAIRKLSLTGKNDQVTTLYRSLPEQHDAMMRRPTGLAWGPGGVLYVSDSTGGRILQLLAGGELGVLQSAMLKQAANAADITDFSLQLARPTALAVRGDGSLAVAAAGSYRIENVVPLREGERVPTTLLEAAQQATDTAMQNIARFPGVRKGQFPWPFKPQQRAHEVVGTLGEVRGNFDGESRDHLHGGLDVQAPMGSTVLVVADDKVSDPISTWAFGKPGEGLSINTFNYIHMQVGRTAEGKSLDPTRFLIQNDASGKPAYVRVKRGTRFAVGDPIGSVNRMYHTHLSLIVGGVEINPLVLPFSGMRDDIAPTIRQVQLLDGEGRAFDKKEHGRLSLPAGGKFGIVVEAFDQMNGNQKRRQLGLFRAGYQILTPDGKPVAGYEQPLVTIDFSRLPDDHAAVKIAYADNSGITVYGSAATRMRYAITNRVRDGLATRALWDTTGLPPGNYLLRVYASDFAGNLAGAGRDIAIALAP